MSPSEDTPFVNRVQRIDEDICAGNRQSGGDGAFAEPEHQREFRLASQARSREPGGKLGQLFFIDHADA